MKEPNGPASAGPLAFYSESDLAPGTPGSVRTEWKLAATIPSRELTEL